MEIFIVTPAQAKCSRQCELLLAIKKKRKEKQSVWRLQVNPGIWVHLTLSDGFGLMHTCSPDLEKLLLENQMHCSTVQKF